MKKTFYIKVIWRDSLSINLTLEEMKQVPTLNHSVWHYHQELIQVDYTPGAPDFDEDKFRKLTAKSVRRQFKHVVSVQVMDDQPMLD